MVLAVVYLLRRPSLRYPECGGPLALHSVGVAPWLIPVGGQGPLVCPPELARLRIVRGHCRLARLCDR
eukprot:5982590-Pyramimonas_sp.AAC.1